MAEEAKLEKEILAELKKDYPMTKESTREINLGHFSSFRNGDNFKITYAWKLTNSLQQVSFVKYRNVAKKDKSRYAGVCIELTHLLPEFKITANTENDKFLNLYLPNSVKVKAVPAFNHKYILEAADAGTIEQTIGIEFFNKMMSVQDLNVEVKDHKCLIYGVYPFNYDSCKVMFQLAEDIVKMDQPNQTIQ
ncbi:hypothetical protein SIO70_14265 [Chitinophaga sancti]|uniref:hypothetical protein n=1 Tax=Chitinophaga sancti TaxID=1004 RepID=UPI002A765116|nr:hypothetical protein [Chitinophaga sancti]WPQ66023.1 hypothetical protein SIO70_14265 [Chitinophaga sancti]